VHAGQLLAGIQGEWNKLAFLRSAVTVDKVKRKIGVLNKPI
jgi:hypothetical protein